MLKSSSEDSDDLYLIEKFQKKQKISIKKHKQKISKTAVTLENDTQSSHHKSQPRKTARKSTGCRRNIPNESKIETKSATPLQPKKSQITVGRHGHCPICQAPFSCLTIESTQWHVDECMQLSLKKNKKECPLGKTCESEILSHYEKYFHTELAKSRDLDCLKQKATKSLFPNREQNVESQKSSQNSIYIIDDDDTLTELNDKIVMENVNDEEITILPSSSKEFKEEDRPSSGVSSSSHFSVLDELPSFQTISPLIENKFNSTGNTDVVTINSSSTAQSSSDSDIDEATFDKQMESYIKSCSNNSCQSTELSKNNNIENISAIDNKNITTQSTIKSFFAKKDLELKEKMLTIKNNESCEKKPFIKKNNPTNYLVCDKDFSSRKCPFYKRIPDTKFTVDAFSYGIIPNCDAYFLTHFHSDHYSGLTKNFNKPIYCTKITANLLIKRLHINSDIINILKINISYTIQDIRVTLLDANHCPGSVMILFLLKNGKCILHTGDFRSTTTMEQYQALENVILDRVYLDTTYCQPKYSFPSQESIIKFVVEFSLQKRLENGKTVFILGTYGIGKEKIFYAIAEALNSKVYVTQDKLLILKCLENKKLEEKLTQNREIAQVHLLPMYHIHKYEKLKAYLSSLKPTFNQLIAFKPTGWSFNKNGEFFSSTFSKEDVHLYSVAYSEHSSFLELKRFVQHFKPKEIIPTVNNGNMTSREKMKNIFKEWLNNS